MTSIHDNMVDQYMPEYLKCSTHSIQFLTLSQTLLLFVLLAH